MIRNWGWLLKAAASAAGYPRSMLPVAGMLPLSIGGFGVREGGWLELRSWLARRPG